MAQPATSPEKDTADTAANQEGKEGLTQIPADQTPYELSPEKMMMDNLFILGMLFFIFYFILIRPQQKRMKVHRDLMKTLQKGNKVLTNGGLIGIINKFDGEEVVVLEVAQNVRVRVARAAISEVLSDKASAESANDN